MSLHLRETRDAANRDRSSRREKMSWHISGEKILLKSLPWPFICLSNSLKSSIWLIVDDNQAVNGPFSSKYRFDGQTQTIFETEAQTSYRPYRGEGRNYNLSHEVISTTYLFSENSSNHDIMIMEFEFSRQEVWKIFFFFLRSVLIEAPPSSSIPHRHIFSRKEKQRGRGVEKRRLSAALGWGEKFRGALLPWLLSRCPSSQASKPEWPPEAKFERAFRCQTLSLSFLSTFFFGYSRFEPSKFLARENKARLFLDFTLSKFFKSVTLLFSFFKGDGLLLRYARWANGPGLNMLIIVCSIDLEIVSFICDTRILKKNESNLKKLSTQLLRNLHF